MLNNLVIILIFIIMKVNVKTIGYVIGVDCAGLPVVVNHYVEQAEGEMSYDVNDTQADLKFAKKCSHFLRNCGQSQFAKKCSPFLCKSFNSRRNCGQSQKDIRLNYK